MEEQPFAISSVYGPTSESVQSKAQINTLPSLSTPTLKLRKRVRNPNLSSSKNIMKNYARALANFAGSNIAVPYLRQMIDQRYSKSKKQAKERTDNIESELSGFKQFIEKNKQKINCIKNLRGLLLAEDKDADNIKLFKELFKNISVIFLKFFSVNWLFSSKIGDKAAHLKYRLRLLRRVQNPKFFTYLEDFSRK